MNAFTLHINVYDLAFVGAIFIGLTFALQLGFTKGVKRAANRFLSLALATMVLWLLWVLGRDIDLGAYFSHWSWLPLQFSLALGPFIYFYVLKTTRPELKFRFLHLLHFSPLLLQTGALVLEIDESIKTGAATYDTPIFQQLNSVLQLLTFISVCAYLYLSYSLIERFYKRLKFSGGDRYRYEFWWLHRLLRSFGLLWLLWIPYTAIDYFGYHYRPGIHAYYPLYLLLAGMVIWIAAAAYVRALAGGPAETPAFIKPLLPTELKQKGTWLKQVMKANPYYQDPELNLNSLADKLGLTPHELSRIINTALKKNFHDFISEYRVAAVIEKMQDARYDHITLLGIAYDSGFNSKSTFNRIFKEMTGKSPAEYKNDLKKEFPVYKLGRSVRFAAVISNHETTQKWSSKKFNRSFMFRNYFKMAWRNLVRQRLFSLINISGLAVGLSVCMLIMIYVAHEHSYDRFHKNADRIFKPKGRVITDGPSSDLNPMTYASGPILKQSLPVVEDYMRTMNYFGPAVVVSNPKLPQRKFTEDKLLFADAGFFNFFSFKLLSGQSSQVLSKPFSVVIAKDIAKKYFGDENPVGQTLTIKTDSAHTYLITGVSENCPSNSSIQYNFVASVSGFAATKEAKPYLGDQKLGGGNFDVYLLLKHRSDTAAVARGLKSLFIHEKDHAKTIYSALPIVDQHLNSRSRDDANLKYLTIFPLVALLILSLALVNYMSLSTARATVRAKEIGVRKISGASRKSVALQFYIESAVFATISFLLGYTLCYLFKPVFFNVVQLKIDDSFLYSPLILSLLFILLLVTVVISGSYPSLVLSAFKPVVTLKGKMGKQSGGVMIRKIFTTLQFTISVALIICGIIIDRQLYFFRHTDIGVDRENVVMIPVGPNFKNYAGFNHEIRALAAVSTAATSRYGMFSYIDRFGIPGKTKDETVSLPSLVVDKDFFQLLGLKWKYPPLAHANLSTGNKVVLNELAVEELHLPLNPVGSYIKSNPKNTEVAGVVKNFNFSSLEDPIEPIGLWILPDTAKYWKTQGGSYLFAKIKPHTNLPTLLGAIQKIYKKHDADMPFDYTFMDDAFNARYKAEDRLASIFSIFTVITIVLAGMGLFGLAAFTIEQRTKEIGIRKVLGASISSINGLLSKDFLKLVFLSILIASPIAWYVMHSWLQGFAYRIYIQWWMFAGAGLLAVTVAVITISYHAVKAAIVNPVNSLRSE
ncbi:ABC transporter permease [Mucilaginibacter sp. BJC16-A38]|uniref:ABC transporter permease n=1 Tax=Mucilaginibacter phenanthrenivorans TaxID=1234842 RepID=UPI0021573761|nr:ABC transporter permease [Mucilaginibacter phenanthrenivorans]MCR8556753.1 ABC transporter permease [Mucilaginibacter phenanthrenivorans]